MSASPERPPVSAHLLPSLIPPHALRGGVAVVLDVLRATTVMVQALSAGIEAIIPCLEIEQAQEVAAKLGRQNVILGGERQGLPIDGFDLGNSPASYTAEVCRNKTLVMTTTNGTQAIHASLEADRVLIASFGNLSSVLKMLQNDPRPIHVVCAGTDGRVSLEDCVLAGAICGRLTGNDKVAGNDEAFLLSRAWADIEYRTFEKQGLSLADVLKRGRGGRRVLELGLEHDLEDAARVDGYDLVPELRRDPLRIVRATE